MRDRRGSLLQASLLRLVRRGAWSHAGRLLQKSHPADIAHVLDRLTESDRVAVFELLSEPGVRAEVLALIEFSDRARLIAGRSSEEIAETLSHMSTDDAALVLREFPRDRADEILACLGEDAIHIESLLGFAEDTAGGIMAPDYYALSEDLTVRAAIERLQGYDNPEVSFYVYVIDDHGYLVGVLSLRQLITQAPEKRLRDFMVRDPIRVSTDTDQEDVARIVARYDLLAVPVVDNTNRLVGVVTVDDVVDVMREEATEDILKMAGTTVEEVLSPTALRGAWIRLPWLAAAFVGGFLGIYMLARFEDVLTRTVELAFFLPIILAMGGNVGSQCSMVVVRGIATGRLEIGSLGGAVWHEVGTSVILATLFATGLGLAASFGGFGTPSFAVAVGLGMFSSMMMAAAVGTALPLLLRRLGADPAVASGPFVTTSVDVAGILAFCTISASLI